MKKGDFLVIAFVAVLAFAWFFIPNDGKIASIYINGALYKKVSLLQNSQTVVTSKYGTNTVVVKDGEVFITDADCKNKDCEKEKIKSSARTIVCLPNRLSVIIEKDKEKEADVVI